MADQRVTELVAVVTPALTDITAVRQSGDDRDKKETLQQIIDLVPPSPQGLGVWKFRTETTEPPALGQVRFNDADISSATELYISETNSGGPTDVSAFMDILLIPGSVLFIQDRINADNRVFVECGAVTDEGTYRKIIIVSVTEVGTEPSNNTDVIIVVQTAAGGGGAGFPEFQFGGSDFLNPNNSDWAVNALAPASAGQLNPGLSVRRFDDTVEEGVGFLLKIPGTATNIVFGFTSRAISPQPTPNNVGVNIYNRGIPDNVLVQAWSAGDQLTDIALPNNTNFVEDSESVTLASLGITAGELTQFELTRIAPTGGDNQFGDWELVQFRVSFT